MTRSPSSLQNQNFYYQQLELDQRKSWYSSVADAYDKTRPSYPRDMIEQVVQLARLPVAGKILELGCGPGKATVTFAQLGYQVTGLEPSLAACQFAHQNCAQYPQVEIQNSTFEEWLLQTEVYDAVLAASSFHWIDAQLRYTKTAAALKPNGALILLWNAPFCSQPGIYEAFNPVYQKYTPGLNWYETKQTHADNIQALAATVIESGYFQNLQTGEVIFELTYSADDYVMFLSTLSPYLKLEPQTRDSLFTNLKAIITDYFAGQIQQSFLSIYHVAHKANFQNP